MRARPSRRAFLRSTAGAGLTGFGLAGFGLTGSGMGLRLGHRRDVVRFEADVEPLVQLLEQTPRERVLEEFAARIKAGATYDQVMTALLLAGVRNIPPRPDSGWKFHCVLVLNSAHLASRALPPEERWLPVFFGLDFFKSQQAYDERESEWSLGPVDEAAVGEAADPAAARRAFEHAMEDWDDARADAAVAGLVRAATAPEVFELTTYYGMRDFRFIGHKPIYAAGAWRLLQTLGWRHAEPVMRSLVYSCLNHHDEPNPADSELAPDGPWRRNLALVEQIGPGWQAGEPSAEATAELLATLRSDTWERASEHAAELLNADVAPQAVVDALFAGSSEILLRQPGIVSLHALTATNALAYAYRTSADDRTQRLLLLQNAAFLVQFREQLKELGPWSEDRIDELEPLPSESSGPEALEEVFDLIAEDRPAAAGLALSYLRTDPRAAERFMTAARRLIALKVQNGHHYKFGSAVMEDYHVVSPVWRERMLAASVYYLRGSGHPDHPTVARTRAALRS